MTSFSKIHYPRCPECKILLNDLRMFDLQALQLQQFFHERECIACGKKFLLRTFVELHTEVEAIQESS